jgi:hypothetical protein
MTDAPFTDPTAREPKRWTRPFADFAVGTPYTGGIPAHLLDTGRAVWYGNLYAVGTPDRERLLSDLTAMLPEAVRPRGESPRAVNPPRDAEAGA